MRHLADYTGLGFIDSFIEDILTGKYRADLQAKTSFYFNDVNVFISEPRPDLDFAQFGRTQFRWKHFLTDYFNRQELEAWVKLCQTKGSESEIGLLLPRVKENTSQNKHLSNCLYGFSYRKKPYPNLTMFSRTVNLIPTGILDLSMANILAEKLGCTITWNIATLQLHVDFGYVYIAKHWLPNHPEAELLPEVETALHTWKKRMSDYEKKGIAPSYHRAESVLKAYRRKSPSFIPRDWESLK